MAKTVMQSIPGPWQALWESIVRGGGQPPPPQNITAIRRERKRRMRRQEWIRLHWLPVGRYIAQRLYSRMPESFKEDRAHQIAADLADGIRKGDYWIQLPLVNTTYYAATIGNSPDDKPRNYDYVQAGMDTSATLYAGAVVSSPPARASGAVVDGRWQDQVYTWCRYAWAPLVHPSSDAVPPIIVNVSAHTEVQSETRGSKPMHSHLLRAGLLATLRGPGAQPEPLPGKSACHYWRFALPQRVAPYQHASSDLMMRVSYQRLRDGYRQSPVKYAVLDLGPRPAYGRGWNNNAWADQVAIYQCAAYQINPCMINPIEEPCDYILSWGDYSPSSGWQYTEVVRHNRAGDINFMWQLHSRVASADVLLNCYAYHPIGMPDTTWYAWQPPGTPVPPTWEYVMSAAAAPYLYVGDIAVEMVRKLPEVPGAVNHYTGTGTGYYIAGPMCTRW